MSISAEQVNQVGKCRLVFFQASESYCAYIKMNAKLDRNVTECDRFRIGTERLNRGALATTLARQC